MRDYSNIDMEWVLPEDYDPATEGTLYWIICYPKGDRSTLSVANMCDGTSYEENDYDLASRKRFRDEQMAQDYCRDLAIRKGLKFDSEGSIMVLD